MSTSSVWRRAQGWGERFRELEETKRIMANAIPQEVGGPRGMVESGVKQFKARFTGAGMRWNRTGAERLMPVCAAVMGRRFDELWQKAYVSVHLSRSKGVCNPRFGADGCDFDERRLAKPQSAQVNGYKRTSRHRIEMHLTWE
jgi:hypothetical protein